MRNNQTYAVLGTEKTGAKALYPIEAQLRTLCRQRGGYIVAVLACCREKFEVGTVGQGAMDLVTVQGDESNLYLTFGCPPNKGVPGATTISKKYFAQLKSRANPQTGAFTIPEALLYWNIHGSEPLNLLSRPAQLQHADWEPIDAPVAGPSGGAGAQVEEIDGEA